ncbi:hypothetical protein ABPG74_013986 [Tetrahymena malaccensis]
MQQLEVQQKQSQFFCDIHQDEPIIAVCLKDDCELDSQRFLCLNCLLNEHSMHPQSCVKLRELTKNSNQQFSSSYNILNWPQDKAIQKIMQQVNDEKKKDDSLFVENLFDKFQEDIIKQIQIAKKEIIKIVESEKQQRQQFLQNLEQKINQIIDLRPLKEIIFDQPNLIEQSVYNSLAPSPSCQAMNKVESPGFSSNVDSQVQLNESKKLEQIALQNIQQGQSLKESINLLKDSIINQIQNTQDSLNNQVLQSQQKNMYQSVQLQKNNSQQGNLQEEVQSDGLVNSSNNLTQTIYLGNAASSSENNNNNNGNLQSKISDLAIRSKRLGEYLKNDKKKRQGVEVKEYYVKNKTKLGSSLQLKNFNDEKQLILSQIEDIPWVLLKFFVLEKQKINFSNTDLQEENTLAVFQGQNTSNLVYSDLPFSNGVYSIKIQVQNILTQHLLIGLVQEQYKDTLNFNNNCWIYQCLLCKNQEHSKNMRRNHQNVSSKISSLITVRINFEENQLNIYDINDNLISSMYQDIDLKTHMYRFFISSMSQQAQNVQLKLVQSIKLLD